LIQSSDRNVFPICPADKVFCDSDVLLRTCPRVTGLPQLISKTFQQCMTRAVSKLLKPYWTHEKL
jgi:hypothetical protein